MLLFIYHWSNLTPSSTRHFVMQLWAGMMSHAFVWLVMWPRVHDNNHNMNGADHTETYDQTGVTLDIPAQHLISQKGWSICFLSCPRPGIGQLWWMLLSGWLIIWFWVRSLKARVGVRVLVGGFLWKTTPNLPGPAQQRGTNNLKIYKSFLFRMWFSLRVPKSLISTLLMAYFCSQQT